VITTEVLCKSGEPIVLSGLVQNESSFIEQRTPGLGKIPGLGWAFKGRKETEEKTEMVIYLVPHWEKDEAETVVAETDQEFFMRINRTYLGINGGNDAASE
jgi:type II secretory pathway component GspD/PulD (secretin)